MYESLMEAMGYSQNREPFLELARRVPYRLLSESVLKLSGAERRYEIQANLLWVAGFQPPSVSSGHHSYGAVQAHHTGSAGDDGRRTPGDRPDGWRILQGLTSRCPMRPPCWDRAG